MYISDQLHTFGFQNQDDAIEEGVFGSAKSEEKPD